MSYQHKAYTWQGNSLPVNHSIQFGFVTLKEFPSATVHKCFFLLRRKYFPTVNINYFIIYYIMLKKQST
jgi:hypothetical protein